MRHAGQNAKLEALRRAPLFEGLTKKELAELAKATDELSVPAGTVLCREGSLGNEFFVVLDGTADVTKGGKVLATRSSGDFFGEIALLATTKRTATVTATTDLRCFVLTSRAFRGVLDDNHAVERKVMQALAQRLLSYADDPTL